MNICAKIGISLAQHGDFVHAHKFLADALKANPTDKALLNFMGLTYGQTGDYKEAEKCYRKLLRFGGGDDLALSNLASMLNEMGRFDEAERMFKTSLRRQPDNLVSQYNLGLLQLLKGDFAQGWVGFECRNSAKGMSGYDIPNVKRWQGEPIDGCAVLLYAEQGLGDTIQFARYATKLAAMGADVFIKCDDALSDLIGSIEGVVQAGRSISIPQGLDFYVSLLSLPKLLETVVSDIPNGCPYLSVSRKIPQAASQALNLESVKLRVGLVWAGNPKHQSDRTRSIYLDVFAPLLTRQDIEFYSLQAGDSVSEIDRLDESLRPTKMFPIKRPLSEVASAMQHLDLVISVDTSLAHLAGALSVPVWTLISFYPDWRWMLERTDSPWYPSMRLFRQPELGDWKAVIEEIGLALDVLIAQR